MDCGIPFCNNGCPLGNLIPDWNDLVYRDHWRDAIERLHATNNFPEFTGRLCPAPCEAACVLGINADPVTIKQVEVEIVDRAWTKGWIIPQPPLGAHRQAGRGDRLGPGRPGRRPAAHPRRPRRRRARAGRPHRRAAALRHPRVQDGEAPPRAPPRPDAGRGHRVPRPTPRSAATSTSTCCWPPTTPSCWRAAPRPGATCPSPAASSAASTRRWSSCRWANRVQEGDLDAPPLTAAGKHVVIIGGGDTGADCLGTVHRQGAASVHQFEILPRPPDARATGNPWPQWSMIYRTSSAHEEGGERVFSVNTECFLGDERRQGDGAAGPRGRDGRGPVREGRGHRLRAAVRAGAAGHGLRRPRGAAAGSSSSASTSTSAATSPATPSS